MRQTTALPDLVVGAPGDGPVVLAGTPGTLRGRLHVTNPGRERTSLHGFLVRSHDLPEQPGAGRLGVRLPPGASLDATASLTVPPGTPPGEYHATLDVAGHEIEATVHVVSDPSLELSPSRVFVDPGTTRVRLVARNTGNVRLQLAPRSRARLVSDPDLMALAPRASTEAEPGGRPSLDATLLVPGPVALDPGEVTVIDVEILVDGQVDGERRFLALLPVATATLRVVVGPNAKAKATSTRATRRRDA